MKKLQDSKFKSLVSRFFTVLVLIGVVSYISFDYFVMKFESLEKTNPEFYYYGVSPWLKDNITTVIWAVSISFPVVVLSIGFIVYKFINKLGETMGKKESKTESDAKSTSNQQATAGLSGNLSLDDLPQLGFNTSQDIIAFLNKQGLKPNKDDILKSSLDSSIKQELYGAFVVSNSGQSQTSTN